ncbi:MAG: methyltransferase domain-containing protein, partial [Planctomycetes bacterium]|nr:methyltransferase domain-containing protein [Planctomycetota bacterium]
MASTCCRFCETPLTHTFVDLGMSPLSNRYLTEAQAEDHEPFHPLHVYVCEECLLVQLPEWVNPDEIFSDYAYFSSYSTSWLAHAERYSQDAIGRYGIDESSFVVEIASNDGYLLRNFVAREIPVLGIEPARNVAEVAEQAGIPTISEFFGTTLADRLVSRGIRADLLIGNNVLAHVPDLRDFVTGLRTLLAPGGVVTLEFPHLLRLMQENQFDTIYHEHFSYFSLMAASGVLERHGLHVFDVDELPTHGGSLRIYAAAAASVQPVTERVEAVIQQERRAGLDVAEGFSTFAARAEACREGLLEFLERAAVAGQRVVGYGAAAK